MKGKLSQPHIGARHGRQQYARISNATILSEKIQNNKYLTYNSRYEGDKYMKGIIFGLEEG